MSRHEPRVALDSQHAPPRPEVQLRVAVVLAGQREVSYNVACPTCGGDQSTCTNTRQQRGGVRRTRHCTSCGARFFTREALAGAMTPREVQLEQALRALIGDEQPPQGG